jgi:hypothetical protein
VFVRLRLFVSWQSLGSAANRTAFGQRLAQHVATSLHVAATRVGLQNVQQDLAALPQSPAVFFILLLRPPTTAEIDANAVSSFYLSNSVRAQLADPRSELRWLAVFGALLDGSSFRRFRPLFAAHPLTVLTFTGGGRGFEIDGSEFVSPLDPSLTCLFRGQSVPAAFVSGSRVVCTLPDVPGVPANRHRLNESLTVFAYGAVAVLNTSVIGA